MVDTITDLLERTDELLTRVDLLLLGYLPIATLTYDSATTDADPGAGEFRFDHATFASITKVWFDDLDTGGESVAAYINSFDDAANGVRGILVLKGVTTPRAFRVFKVTGPVVDKSGYREVPVSPVMTSGTWLAGEGFSPLFSPAGDTGASYAGSSTTSLTLGTGTKAFTTQAGLAYQVGTRVRASDAANPTTKFLEGVVTSYVGTALTIASDYFVGTGTVADWKISVSGDGAVEASASATAAAASATAAAASQSAAATSETNAATSASTATTQAGIATAAATSLASMFARNAQSGTSYTIVSGDKSKHLTFANAAATAVTLPQAGSTGFEGNFWITAENVGLAVVTITPTTSTINGWPSLVLFPGQHAIITSDGTNYRALVGGQIEYRNAIVNGDGWVWQRGTSFPALASGEFFADRWKIGAVGAAVCTPSQSNDVPDPAIAGEVFPFSYDFQVTTADASLASGDAYHVQQSIEGTRWATFHRRECVLEFWWKSKKTGKTYASLRNAAVDRSLPISFTVNAADTWEKKVLRIPAHDASGTWLLTNGIGAYFTLALSSGSVFHGTADQWQSGNVTSASDAVNHTDSTANYVRFIGVRLRPARSVIGVVQDLDTAIRECRRYYRRIANTGRFTQGFINGTTLARFLFDFGSPMRAAPNLSLSAASHFQAEAGSSAYAGSAFTAHSASLESITLDLTISGAIDGQGAILRDAGGGNAVVTISAEI